MSNEIVKAEMMPLADVTNYGKIFAESGMFENVKSQAQAVVRILAGQEIGIPPFASISGIHIIKGKPSMGAGLMASRVKGSGKYDYKVKDHTDKVCSIDFYQNYTGKFELIGNSTFTIEDAKKAQTQNLDRFPRNMLFARAISNGIKWFTPDIFAGPVYVPEEMPTLTEDVAAEITTAPNGNGEQPAPAKTLPAISEKQFTQLSKRIADSANQPAAMELLNKAQASFTVSEQQATELVNSISILPLPVTA